MKQPLIALLLIIIVPAIMAAPPRAIPGITAKDTFPAGCVDCHVKERRVSVLLKAPTMKKKHPPVVTKGIPASCMKCHSATSKIIPPFAPLMHRLHLGKGDASQFVIQFGGECTHCHKLNKTTGAWSVPAGAEK
jgi:nitrate/TMAO reductase-like tetraheme cytochrome c subunit